MKDLKCLTMNCENNALNHCMAGFINVNEKGVCASKQKRAGGMLAQSYADMEASQEIERINSEEVSVTCDCCDCVFNDNYSCSAKGLVLDDGMLSKTKCCTKKKA